MGKVFITGGSGFVGTHLIPSIKEKKVVNYDILPPLKETNAQYIQGDIFDQEKLVDALQDVEIVYHLAATHFDFQKNYHRTNVEGTASLIAAAETAGVDKIVFLSSVAVYGEITKPTSEADEPSPNMPYGKSKLDAEKLLVEWHKKDTQRLLLICRPTVVFGPGNFGNVLNLIKQIDSGIYFHLGTGTNVKSVTYVSNLVHSCTSLAESLETGMHIFNNIDEPQLNTNDLSNLIARILDKRIKLRIPRSLALILALPFDLMRKFFGLDTPISKERLLKFMASTHFLPEFLMKAGIKPPYSAEEGLKETIAWYKSVDWIELRKEWKNRVEQYS